MPGRAARVTVDNSDALLRVADRLAPEMRRAYLLAVQQLRAKVSVDTLTHILTSSSPKTAIAQLDAILAGDTELQAAAVVMRDGFLQAAQASSKALGQVIGEGVRFNATNPQAIRAAERVAARLVTNVSRETRLAIREVVVQSFRQQITSRDTAIQLRELVGLTRQQARSVRRFRFELLAEGVGASAVERQVAALTARLIRSRATVIARTELLSAANAGQLEAWLQAKREGLIGDESKKIWIVTPDDRLCPRCAPLEHHRPIALHEPFDTVVGPLQRPPLHPHCRCTPGLVLVGGEARRAA